jgi:hypothetical protein
MLPGCVERESGFLPVSLSEDGRVGWRDVGSCPFDHALFEWSLESWDPAYAERPTATTGLDLFARSELPFETLPPAAFVFHMSRCGSSLLVRALGQSHRLVVMSEVPVLNQLLRRLCRDDLAAPIADPEARRVLRNFVLALGRRRDPRHQKLVVKFSSWNVLLLDSIRAVFPGVPCLFLYREPAEVMVSLLRGPPGFVRDKGSRRSRSLSGLDAAALERTGLVEYTALCLQRMMTAALASEDLEYLAHCDLVPASFGALAQRLGIACGAEELTRMTAQFAFDAKAFARDAVFVDDGADKRRFAGPEVLEAVSRFLAAPYDALETSARNLRAHLQEGRHAG